MVHFSKTSLSPVDYAPQYGDMSNNAWPTSSSNVDNLVPRGFGIILVFSPCICTIGLLGNGTVIYLLGFYLKWSPFTTYILNLAVANFGALLFLSLILVTFLTHAFFFIPIHFMAATFMHSASQLLLMAISIDRCMSVLFPVWHRCHRPPHLSTMVCALMWILSCLPAGIVTNIFCFDNRWTAVLWPFFPAAVILCYLLITISTLILLFKGFCKAQQPRRGRLFTIVFLALLSFLIFALPPSVLFTLHLFDSDGFIHLICYVILCSSLNSCVNPVIYYMVGRKKRGGDRQSLKAILQRAFEEEEEERREERGTTAQTSL